MGNCMKTCMVISKNKVRINSKSERGEENHGNKIGGDKGNFVKDVVNSKNGLRVKMVLTKEELQWLMMLLSNRENGGKSIEDVFREIDRKGRTKKVGVHGWRPSLESIKEIPEVLEMNKG